MPGSDFLDEIIAEATEDDPTFPDKVKAAYDRRLLVAALAQERERQGLSQTAIAARMGTSQSAVARLEGAKRDVRISTFERYAAAVGKRITWDLKSSSSA